MSKNHLAAESLEQMLGLSSSESVATEHLVGLVRDNQDGHNTRYCLIEPPIRNGAASALSELVGGRLVESTLRTKIAMDNPVLTDAAELIVASRAVLPVDEYDLKPRPGLGPNSTLKDYDNLIREQAHRSAA